MDALRERLSSLRLRLRALLHRRRLEGDLEEELRFHLEEKADTYRRQGLDASEAVRRARLRFGSSTSFREALRDMWTFRWLEELRHDVGYAARAFRRNPAFSAATILTLALGIGSSTAIFSVVSTVLLRPLPYDDSDGIYRVRTMDTRGLPLGTVGQAHIDPLGGLRGGLAPARGRGHLRADVLFRAMRTVIASQLYLTSALDPLVFVVVPLAMLVVAILSAYLPARRAAAIDPAVILRGD